MGDVVIFCQGVSFPGRYGHGKPAKPVNTAFLPLHRFQNYITSVCFYGHFYINEGANFCSGVVSSDSIYFFYPCPGSRVNSGIASVYGRFRYFSLLHNFTFHHFSSHLFAPQSSKSSSKFFRKSGRQSFHFLAGGSISSVCIVVQSHIDAVVPHDILQCFRVHPGTCHFRAERMP